MVYPCYFFNAFSSHHNLYCHRVIGLPVLTSWHIPPATPLIFLAFFFAAAGEELGYMGYAIDPI